MSWSAWSPAGAAGGEVIVVSDGSTDRTAEVARAAATEAEIRDGGSGPHPRHRAAGPTRARPWH